MEIELTSGQDNRNPNPDKYAGNARMGTFLGSWSNPIEENGRNTWAHIGGFCRRQFGTDETGNWTIHERRLVFLGLIVAYVNSDRCANWTDEEREQAIRVAWDFIDSNR